MFGQLVEIHDKRTGRSLDPRNRGADECPSPISHSGRFERPPSQLDGAGVVVLQPERCWVMQPRDELEPCSMDRSMARVGRYSPRVVLDLMVHDLDIACAIFEDYSPNVSAIGQSLQKRSTSSATLTFGGSTQLTESRDNTLDDPTRGILAADLLVS